MERERGGGKEETVRFAHVDLGGRHSEVLTVRMNTGRRGESQTVLLGLRGAVG